jgi:hypothetical protein
MKNSGPYSKPAATFEKMKRDFMAAAKKDAVMSEAYERLRKFKGVFNTDEDAKRLDELRNRGAEKLGIKVGTLPLAIGPGLVFMYDAILEAIRLDPGRFDSKMLGRRSMRTAEILFDDFLLQIGARSVTALERALEDDEYADRLRNRAKQLDAIARQAWDPEPGVCEFCTVVYKDTVANVYEVRCPSQEECDNFLWAILIMLLIWLTLGVLEWLFG